MKIVICPTASRKPAAVDAAAQAIAEACASCGRTVERVPLLADGGEGTLDALVSATGGCVAAPHRARSGWRAGRCAFAVLGDGETVLIEMAEAAGLMRIRAASATLRARQHLRRGRVDRRRAGAGARRICWPRAAAPPRTAVAWQ